MKNKKLVILSLLIFVSVLGFWGFEKKPKENEALALEVGVVEPSSVIVAVDISNTMAYDNKLNEVNSSVSSFVTSMNDSPASDEYYPACDHEIALIGFKNSVFTRSFNSNLLEVESNITDIFKDPESFRKTELALDSAIGMFANYNGCSEERTLILITDGLPNSDVNSVNNAIDVANSIKYLGVRVVALGINKSNKDSGTTQEVDPEFEAFIREMSSSSGDCYYLDEDLYQNPGLASTDCKVYSTADLNSIINDIFFEMSSTLLNDTPPVINSIYRRNYNENSTTFEGAGPLFEMDRFSLNASAIDDIGFKEFYLVWDESSDWFSGGWTGDSDTRNKVDCENLGGVVNEDGQRTISLNTDILGPFPAGQNIKYQVFAKDASDNYTASGVENVYVASISAFSPYNDSYSRFVRNKNNKIDFYVQDSSGSVFNQSQFYLTLTSSDTTKSITRALMSENLDNYYYYFNPDCSWYSSYNTEGTNKRVNDIYVDIKIETIDDDLDYYREIYNSTNNIISSIDSDEIYALGSVCSNGINDDCDYDYSMNPLIDIAGESACDGSGPVVSVSTAEANIYDNDTGVTFISSAYDSNHGIYRNIIYYRLQGVSTWSSKTCTDANVDGMCDEYPGVDIGNFTIFVSDIFPLSATKVVEYKATAIDSSENSNATTTSTKTFMVKSFECDGVANLGDCTETTGGKCCGGVCNPTLFNSGIYDIDCSKTICDGTTWKAIADTSKLGEPCATEEGDDDGCYAFTPKIADYPFDYAGANIDPYWKDYDGGASYNPSGCEIRTYTCDAGGACVFDWEATRKYDGCDQDAYYNDFECNSDGITCEKVASWQDPICQSTDSMADLHLIDDNGNQATAVAEMLDVNADENLRIQAIVGDSRGIYTYKIHWRVNGEDIYGNRGWNVKNCGSCAEGTGIYNPCTPCEVNVTNEIGPLYQGDFLDYYLDIVYDIDAASEEDGIYRYIGSAFPQYLYYDGTNFNTFKGSWSDRNPVLLSYNWGTGKVNGGSGQVWENQYDTVSMVWEGVIIPQKPYYDYNFKLKTDDGIKFYLGDMTTPKLSKWFNQGATDYYVNYEFTSGEAVPFKIEWYDNTSNAVMEFSWNALGSGETAYTTIPDGNEETVHGWYLYAPYTISVRDADCYYINSAYNVDDPSTSINTLDSCEMNSNTGVCCAGYCDVAVASDPFGFHEDCHVNECGDTSLTYTDTANDINWFYTDENRIYENKNGEDCGTEGGVCNTYYTGCKEGDKCSGGYCLPDNASIKYDKCSDSVSDPDSGYGKYFHDYGCSGGLCELVTTGLDCSDSCDCSCDRYDVEEKVYSSLKFDGSSDFVLVPDYDSALSISGPMSVEAWVSFDSLKSGSIVSKVQDSNKTENRDNYKLQVTSDGRFSFANERASDDADFNSGTSSVFTANSWHHVVGVFDGKKNYIYVDGVLESSNTNNETYTTYTGSGPLQIGSNSLSTHSSSFFDGYIDEVRVYSRALNDKEIKDHYYGLYYDDSNLEGYWTFDEVTETTVPDESGHDREGYYGAVGVSGGGSTNVYYRANWTTSGKINDGLVFGNSNDFMALYNMPISTSSGREVTVEFWMNWYGGDSEMPIGFTSYDLWLRSGSFGFNTGAGDIWGISSSGLANSWHHVVAVFYNGSGKNSRIYIDGNRMGMSQRFGTTGTRYVTTSAILSGWNNSYTSYNFNGKLDEVRIYNRGLTDEEAMQHYKGIFTEDPVAYWSFDDDFSIFATDDSGNGPEPKRYYYGVTDNNVPDNWQVCSDGKDNDCTGNSDADEPTCDGIVDEVGLDAQVTYSYSEDVVDAEKSWTVNEWAGGTLEFYDSNFITLLDSYTIVSNTANKIILDAEFRLSTNANYYYKLINGENSDTGDFNTSEETAFIYRVDENLVGDGTKYADINDSDIRDPNNNFMVISDSYDDFGIKESFVEWSTDNWLTTNTKECSESICKICVEGAECYNESAGISGSISNKVLDDNSKSWIVDEWEGGTLNFYSDAAHTNLLYQYPITSSTSDSISSSVTISNYTNYYVVRKNADLIDLDDLNAGEVLQLRTCAYDNNLNVKCDDNYFIEINNSNEPPILSNLTVTNPDFCKNLNFRLSWVYYDSSTSQSSYRIQIKETDIDEWDDLGVFDKEDSKYLNFFYTSVENLGSYELEYGKEYNWRVKVADSSPDPYMLESDWAESPDNIVMPDYRYPIVDFDVDPNCDSEASSSDYTECQFGEVVHFTSDFTMSIECRDDADCKTTEKISCGSDGFCDSCVNNGECTSAFGPGWKCVSSLCVWDDICLTSDDCWARDVAVCNEDSICSPCTENTDCEKFNNAEQSFICNVGVCEPYALRQWNFGDSAYGAIDSTEAEPEKIYLKSEIVGAYTVTLRAEDILGRSCSEQKEIILGGRRYPKWNEVSPGSN